MSRASACVAALAWLVAGCSGDGNGQQVLGTLERERLELVAESDEQIFEVAVREGEHVAAGAVLLRQEAGVMQPRIDQGRAALAEAERRLADLVAGPRVREIEDAEAALDGAASTLQTEQREFERVRSLVEQRLLSASSLDQARSRRDAALAARDQARARLGLLREGTRTEQVHEAEAAVARARAALAELETSAARYVVSAPRAGIVEALPYETGERPPRGAPVVVMLADGAPYARVYVPETLRTRFTAGREVQVSIDGVDGVLDGTVRYVSAEAAFTPYYALTQKDRTRLSYLAEIALDDERAAGLPAGVPVQVIVPDAPADPR